MKTTPVAPLLLFGLAACVSTKAEPHSVERPSTVSSVDQPPPEVLKSPADESTVPAEIADRSLSFAESRRAFQLKREQARERFEFAVSLADQGMYQRALETYDEVERLDPHMDHLHYNRGLTLEDLGRRAEAHGAYAKAHEIDPQHRGAEAAKKRTALAD